MNELFPYNVFEFSHGGFRKASITAVREIPLVIRLNGRRVVTLLCTGMNPEALAIGFLRSDGLLKDKKDLKDVIIEQDQNRITVNVSAHVPDFDADLMTRSVTSGCGKGTGFDRNMQAINQTTISGNVRVSPRQLSSLMTELDARSKLYRTTGGCHNAALCTCDNILIFCEDIGRHNAIDMISGICLTDDINTTDKLIMTTGRIASEILIKAMCAGVSILASRSAATNLAIETARKTNLTLVGYLRGNRMRIYNHAGRIEGLS